MGGTLTNLISRLASLPVTEGLELNDLQGPFQHKPFCDYVSTRTAHQLLLGQLSTLLGLPKIFIEGLQKAWAEWSREKETVQNLNLLKKLNNSNLDILKYFLNGNF